MKQTHGIACQKALLRHPRYLASTTHSSKSDKNVDKCSTSENLYGGRCQRCNGNWHSVKPDASALHAARQLLLLLDHYKRFDYQVPVSEAQACFNTDYVWTKGPGRMLGVLVAQHPITHEKVVLKAFSGQLTERWQCPGWVGPVACITSDSQLYLEARSQIEDLSAQMQRLEVDMSKLRPSGSDSNSSVSDGETKGVLGKREAKRAKHRPQRQATQQLWPEWARQQHALLSGQRKSLSHRLIEKVEQLFRTSLSSDALMKELDDAVKQQWQQVQASYVTRDLVGRQVLVLDAYYSYKSNSKSFHASSAVAAHNKFQGFPAGTGDCCLPKLLHAAQQQGLKPLSCVEFWYGSTPSSNTPQGNAATARRSAARAALVMEASGATEKQNIAGTPNDSQPLHAPAKRTAKDMTVQHAAFRHAGSIQDTNWHSVSKQNVMKGYCSLMFDDDAVMLVQGHAELTECLAAYDWTTASRVHGLVYGACDKCQSILGALLCESFG